MREVIHIILLFVILIRGMPENVNGGYARTLVHAPVKIIPKGDITTSKTVVIKKMAAGKREKISKGDKANKESAVPKMLKLTPSATEDKKALKFMKSELGRWIINYSYSRGIDPYLIFAIAERESDLNPDAVGDRGDSIGLMQIQPRWSRERMKRLRATNLKNPKDCVKVAIDILLEYRKEDNDLYFVLMAYNGGMGYAKRNKNNTSDYALKVSDRAVILCRLYEGVTN